MDTAARLANGESAGDADNIRVLAGMIQKLAEQVERLGGSGPTGSSSPTPTRARWTRPRSGRIAHLRRRQPIRPATTHRRKQDPILRMPEHNNSNSPES
jgi:hypothetical protein